MKIKHLIAAIAITGAVGTLAFAQPGGQRGGPPGGPPPGGPGGNPIIDALDTDGNQELSSEEIRYASKSLSALDTNGDGKVSREDMGPPGGGPGGQQGRRGQGGPHRPQADDTDDSDKVSKTFMKRLMRYDKDKSGTIEKDELPDRMQHVMTKADANGDDVLDEGELETMLTGKSKNKTQQNAGGPPRGGPGQAGGGPDPKRMVDHAMDFDTDGDGKLSRTELLAFAESMPAPGGPGGPGGQGGPGGR